MTRNFCGVKGDALWKAGRASDRTNADIQLLSNQNVKPDLWQNRGTAIRNSPAVLDSYLYRKELEMRKIVTALEGIRYGLPASEIMGLLAKTVEMKQWFDAVSVKPLQTGGVTCDRENEAF